MFAAAALRFPRFRLSFVVVREQHSAATQQPNRKPNNTAKHTQTNKEQNNKNKQQTDVPLSHTEPSKLQPWHCLKNPTI